MRLNERQQDFFSDKLGDFGNLVGTGVIVLSFLLKKSGGFLLSEELSFVSWVIQWHFT
jgi:hypothetical protein